MPKFPPVTPDAPDFTPVPSDAPAIPRPRPKGGKPLAELLKERGGARFATAVRPAGVVSTGLLSLDRILGGGWPRGQISELAGENGVGKTTLALTLVAAAQSRGEVCVWIDMEQGFLPDIATAAGVDLSALIFVNPVSAETALKDILDFVNSGEVSVIVLDSIGAFTPQARLDSDIGKALPAIRARVVAELAERLVGPLAATNTTFLAINHLTGLMKSDFYGNQITEAKGGRTFRYFRSAAVHLKAKRPEGDADERTVAVEAIADKSRRSAKGLSCSLVNVLGRGFSPVDDTVNIALELGIVTKGGAWLSFGDHKYQGKAKLAETLAQDPELMRTLRDTVEAAL